MGANPTKAADNVYCQARYKASETNERLKSREGAAELLGISPSSLADYELGNIKFVPVDKVVLMADLYNAPELLNDYCATSCPIGCKSVQKIEVEEIDRITLKMLSAFSQAEGVSKSLIAIVADGVITEDERPEMDMVLADLDNLGLRISEMKLWVEKNYN